VYVEPDGSRIRNVRGSRAFNGAAFARAAGILSKTLLRVERNRGPVSVSTPRKIGSALGIDDPRSLGWIAGGVGHWTGLGHPSGCLNPLLL
jgi:transcriptional regulator with XRE-family HTH domain